MSPDAATRRRDVVRGVIRGLLEQNPDYSRLSPERRRRLAHDLVRLTETTLSLMAEEAAVDAAAARRLAAATGAGGPSPPRRRRPRTSIRRLAVSSVRSRTTRSTASPFPAS